MKKILSLLRMQIDNKTNILKTASPKTMIPAVVKALVILGLGTFIVSFGLSRVYNNIRFAINAELFGIVLLVTQLVSLVFAVGNVINTLYLCKDNELLICLPVTPNQLFISKILLIYLKEIAANAMITLPIFITLGTFARFGAFYYLSLVILTLLLPILPIAVAAFVSLPIMWVIKFLKKHTFLSIVVIFGLICACLWGYMSLIGNIAGEINIVERSYEIILEFNAFVDSVGNKILVYYQLGRAMINLDEWYFFPIFVAVCGAVATVAILFTRRLFFKIAMSSLENTVKAKPKLKEFKRRSQFGSLFQKELFCVFRSTSEIFEYFLFTIIMPFIVFSYDKLLMTVAVNNSVGPRMIAGAHVMVVAILAMLSNISSASAVSRDGGNFHTSKTIPVNFFTQMFVKFSFNVVFTIGAILVTAIISVFFYPAWQIILGSIAVAMAAVGHIAYCISCDIKNPTISAQGDEAASTVSKSTTKCLVAGMLIGFIMGFVVMLMSGVENKLLPYFIIIGGAFIYMLNRVVNLVLRINHNYDKIEM